MRHWISEWGRITHQFSEAQNIAGFLTLSLGTFHSGQRSTDFTMAACSLQAKKREWDHLLSCYLQNLLINKLLILGENKKRAEGGQCKWPHWLLLVRIPCWLFIVLISKYWEALSLHPRTLHPYSSTLLSSLMSFCSFLSTSIFCSKFHFLWK